MSLSPKFMRRVRSSDCHSNSLRIPHGFCSKYASRIPATVKIVVRTGYVIWLDFDKVNEHFKGLRSFYENFSINPGQTLLFKYSGGFEFKICITDVYGSEIEYPNIVHHLQTCRPSPVSIRDGGWSFVRHLGWGGKVMDSIISDQGVPYEFVERVGSAIPARVEFRVSSGYEFVGCYSDISGLVNLCNMLDVTNLNGFKMLAFNYDGVSKFSFTAFDVTLIEALLALTLSADGDAFGFPNPTAFKFVIQDFHMLRYAHGVDIPVEFRSLCSSWSKTDYITAYVGQRCWKLQIRHRSNWKRTTINEGWCVFRDDLQLNTGDLCLFDWRNDTIRNFNVRIVKAVSGRD